MPAPHPKEFRGRRGRGRPQGRALIAQVAADFGISESYLRNWMHRADVEDGVRPGTTVGENAMLKDGKRKIRLLEQWGSPACGGERGPAPGRRVPLPGEPEAGSVRKMTPAGPGPCQSDEVTGSPSR